MSRPLLARLVGAVVASVAFASCSAVRSDVSIQSSEALTPATSPPPSPTTTAVQADNDECDTRSFRPAESTPEPGEMPAGSYMRDIQDRGKLRVVVDDSTLFFSSRSGNGDLEGFEVELARELARAILGDPAKVELIIGGVGDDKLKPIVNGEADAVISVVTVTCKRWRQVAFSRPYYETRQGILVASGSTVSGLKDLDDATVCVTSGSSSEEYVKSQLPDATVLAVESRPDCLVALQEGRCDAVVLPESILAGLHAQDPTADLKEPVPPPRAQYYGIAVPQGEEGFVRFVNGLLERWQVDGTLARLQQEQLSDELRTDPVAPEHGYRD